MVDMTPFMQALMSQQQMNGGGAQGQQQPSPQELFAMHANQAPSTSQTPSYTYRAGLSPADLLTAMNAGRMGQPAPPTPTIMRSRDPGPAPLTGAASAEKRHTFGGTQTPAPAAPASPSPAPAQTGPNASPWTNAMFTPIGPKSDGSLYPKPQSPTPGGYTWNPHHGYFQPTDLYNYDYYFYRGDDE